MNKLGAVESVQRAAGRGFDRAIATRPPTPSTRAGPGHSTAARSRTAGPVDVSTMETQSSSQASTSAAAGPGALSDHRDAVTSTATATATATGTATLSPVSTTPSKRRDPTTRALENIRRFLRDQMCYSILPESYRLIVFDNKLSITKSLQALITNGVVSAPLYDSTTQRFAGMFTLADVVHLIQYYYLTAHEYENVVAEVEAFQLGSLRMIEEKIDVPPPPTVHVHPEQPLADACLSLVRTHARRLPLVDTDEQTGKETIVSVLTQYRVLKFIAINCQHDCARLDQSIGSLGIGSYVSWYSNGASSAQPSKPLKPSSSPSSVTVELAPEGAASATLQPPSTPKNHGRSRSRSITRDAGSYEEARKLDEKYFPLATATLKTSVFDVVHIFSERGISAVPIVDDDGVVINMYETVDIVDLVRQNAYQVLDKTIEVALLQRSADFTGVMTCTPNDSLASILAYIRERRCHRFVIIEGDDVPAEDGPNGRPARKKGSLVGILSLSDVLRYIVGHENLKGHELTGLGVLGIRGVEQDGEGDIPDTSSLATASKAGSRRGSETTDSSSVGPGPAQVAGTIESLSLKDVVEGKVID